MDTVVPLSHSFSSNIGLHALGPYPSCGHLAYHFCALHERRLFTDQAVEILGRAPASRYRSNIQSILSRCAYRAALAAACEVRLVLVPRGRRLTRCYLGTTFHGFTSACLMLRNPASRGSQSIDQSFANSTRRCRLVWCLCRKRRSYFKQT